MRNDNVIFTSKQRLDAIITLLLRTALPAYMKMNNLLYGKCN